MIETGVSNLSILETSYENYDFDRNIDNLNTLQSRDEKNVKDIETTESKSNDEKDEELIVKGIEETILEKNKDMVIEEEEKVPKEKTDEVFYEPVYDWSKTPQLLCTATEDYKPNETIENITRGCQWSPDGTCLLVPASDFRIRVYELPCELYNGKVPKSLPMPPLIPTLKIKEGGLVYDTQWYPSMNSWDPATCCFLSTSQETPIHLWDAFTGQLRATYRAYNQVDEVEAAISVQFINFGNEIWTGFKDALRSFDTNQPGRQIHEILLKNDFPNIRGIISCIRENPKMPGLLAFGSYSKCIGLYKDGPLCSFKTGSGVTQVEFSPCGTRLYSAVRRNNEFLCWDLRNPGIILYSYNKRESNTNQRIQFALSNDGSQIISGGTNGIVNIWKTSHPNDLDNLEFETSFTLSGDCINGVNMHKTLPILATTSGQRLCNRPHICRDNSVRLWHCNSKIE